MIRRSLVLPLILCAFGCDAPKEEPEAKALPTVVLSSHQTKTADGWTIALRRYQKSTGTEYQEPILLSSGFLECGAIFDLSEKYSLARHLAMQGWDVWTFDIRGTGESQSPAVSDLFGWDDVTMDHFVYFDAPAAVEFVRSTTGAQQIQWAGHSLGALMMYAYLESVDAWKVRSAVSLGGIAVLDEDQDLPSKFAEVFFAVGVFLLPFLPSDMPVPLGWAIKKLIGNNTEIWSIVSYLMSFAPTKLLWNPQNINPNLIYLVLTKVLSNTSTNVFKQFFAWAKKGDCFSYGVKYKPPTNGGGGGTGGSGGGGTTGGGNTGGGGTTTGGGLGGGVQAPMPSGGGGPPAQSNGDGTVTIGKDYSFTQNLWRIQRPMLVVSGQADAMAPPDHTVFVYQQVASPDKGYMNCAVSTGHVVDYGHTDMLAGIHARTDVYTHLSDWFRPRSTRK